MHGTIWLAHRLVRSYLLRVLLLVNEHKFDECLLAIGYKKLSWHFEIKLSSGEIK